MELTQVAQFSSDLDRSAAFYARLLGVAETARFDPPGLLFFTVSGIRLLLDAKAPSSLIYFGVDSIEAVIERLGEEARIHTPAHVIFEHEDDRLGPAGTVERQCFLLDPDDNLVGLIEFAARDEP